MYGLIKHYEEIEKGMLIIEKFMQEFVGDPNKKNHCMKEVIEQVMEVEDEADKIKRNIRNHMPKGLVIPVDNTIYFNYTRQQDDILDAGLDSLYWLGMRPIELKEPFRSTLITYIDEVIKTIALLKPALKMTIDLLCGDSVDREEAKSHYREVRVNHKKVNKMQNQMIPVVFNSDREFRDIYQLIHFIQHLHQMSHSAEGCVDMLRAMIAK